MPSVIFVIVQILIFSVYSDSCNYATFSVDTLYPELNVGTFSISTNRCQSLKATFKIDDTFLGFGFTLPFDGSMMMKCIEYSDQYYRLQVYLYSDALCTDMINDDTNDNEPIIIDMDHNKFTIYNNVQFTLNAMNCNSPWQKDESQTSCGISMEMANNCSWSGSERYINISVPDNKCISLAPDFNGLLNIIPFQILPEEFVESLEKQSIQFKCCSSDNSLLISNYSDTTCTIEPDSQFRISNIFNGQCFIIDNNEDMVENKDERDDEIHFNENTPDTFVYIMRWTCNDFQDECDDIPMVGQDMLPQECSQQCIEMANQQHNVVTLVPNNSDSKTNKIIGVVVVVVVVALLFIGIIVGSICYGRRKALQKEVENNVSINMNVKDERLVQGDDKYEAFVSEAEQDNTEITT